jgi:hypothetical protein
MRTARWSTWRNATLFAQPFDPSRVALSGEPVIIATRVQQAQTGGASFAVSDEVIAYQSSDRLDMIQLTWFDRAGRVVSTHRRAGRFHQPRTRSRWQALLASASDDKTLTRDIYIVDVIRGVRQRFTFDPSDERSAVWSPDQTEVIYTSKGLNLYRRSSDLSGEERSVIVDRDSKDPYDWSPDGRSLLYRRTGSRGNDLWLHPLGGGEDRPIAATRFSESFGNFSRMENGSSTSRTNPARTRSTRRELMAEARFRSRRVAAITRDGAAMAARLSMSGPIAR